MIKEISIRTKNKIEFIDITANIEEIVKNSKISDGLCNIFIPHTTCAITINENRDPSVKSDIINELNEIVPYEGGYNHAEGNAAAHIKSSMMGFSESIFIENASLVLGTWQGIYLCEFDGPRTRKIIIKISKD